MGWFDFFKGVNINDGVAQCQADPRGLLLDVRTPEEFYEGHIPGSKNLDVEEMGRAREVLPDLDRPIYTYCHSGARSIQAAMALKRMGYTNVKNIGGIQSYRGKIQQGN